MRRVSVGKTRMQERYFTMIGVDGTIPLDGRDMAAIYASRPDFAKYIESMFRDCLEELCGIVCRALDCKQILHYTSQSDQRRACHL